MLSSISVFFHRHEIIPMNAAQLQKPCHQLLASNRALAFLTKSNVLDIARHLFDKIPPTDDFTWNTIISACARSGRSSDALLLFRLARLHGLCPDRFTLTTLTRVAGPPSHALSLKSGLTADPFLAAALIDAYSLHNDVTAAAGIFDSVPIENRHNHVLWTVMITCHSLHGDGVGAMARFRQMRADGVRPNQFTLPNVLTGCALEREMRFGCQVHACSIRWGFEASRFVQSSLVGLYAKCSDFNSAKRILEFAEFADQVSWNSLVVGCARDRLHKDALSLFAEMRQRGLEIDEFAYPSVLNAIACNGNMHSGRSIHCAILKTGFEGHNHVGNSLVDMYTKCGSLECAHGVFNQMPVRDVVTWTSLFTGTARHLSDEDALGLFIEMRADGVESDEYVMAGVLSSCAGLTLLELGRQVHSVTVRRRFDSFLSVSNSLVSMYAKCGCTDDARKVFDLMFCRDAITWTALIIGYAQNGRGRDSLELYNNMIRTGFKPDYVTFIGLLFACSHAGLVQAGKSHFQSMEKVYCISPGPEHYACMIDLLGRSGRIDEAVELLDQMQIEADSIVWKALLAACKVHHDVSLAEWAAEKLFRLVPNDAVPYILLSNLYSSAGRWEDVARIRSLMKSRGVSKEPGCSWIEVGSVVHVFHVEDRGHPLMAEIYAKVEDMIGRIKLEGYVADTGFSLQDLALEGKEVGLAYHSEKLAVAFGLISVPMGAVIRVYKNLRVCGDCHTALKLVSKVYGREIVLRDSNCFHHLSEGNCSCGDYW